MLNSEKIVVIIKVFNLSIGFPNNKYPPNNKNYLRCLLFKGGVVLGGRDYIDIDIRCSMNNRTTQSKIKMIHLDI